MGAFHSWRPTILLKPEAQTTLSRPPASEKSEGIGLGDFQSWRPNILWFGRLPKLEAFRFIFDYVISYVLYVLQIGIKAFGNQVICIISQITTIKENKQSGK